MLDLNRPFFISPPFGSYFGHDLAYSVLGSFTRYPRPGRWRRVLKTVRPVPSDAGPAWINKIGLRNPGLEGIAGATGRTLADRNREVISLAPLENTDWHAFERFLDEHPNVYPRVEFNVSCPNVDEHPPLPQMNIVKRLLANCPDAIFKLPPVQRSVDAAVALSEVGVRYIHLSNTLPSPIGGISGAPLREVNLPLVEATARRKSDQTCVIAGGGIYSKTHVQQYHNAGASRFAVGSAYFWPPRGNRIMQETAGWTK